jgi:hypothetical protein
MSVVLGGLSEAQRQSWVGLLEVAATRPDGWCLVGGQMVHLHCQERSFAPARPTDDSDVVLDVREHPHALQEFTAALVTPDSLQQARLPRAISTGGCAASPQSTSSSLRDLDGEQIGGA